MKKKENPAKVALRLKKGAGVLRAFTTDAGGWRFVYNIPGFCGGDFYGLSASLWPMGRGSTVKDWDYLGKIMAAIGMPSPEDPSKFRYFTDVKTADPNSVLKWMWMEPSKEEKR